MSNPKKSQPADLRQRISELEQEVVDLTNQWKRAAADYANLEKRVAKGRQEWSQSVETGLLRKVLRVVDSLEKACQHGGGPGVRAILDQCQNLLAAEGVEEIEVLGKEFDPESMEAVSVEGELDKGATIVGEVEEKGYRLKGKLLRVAKVKVSGGITNDKFLIANQCPNNQ